MNTYMIATPHPVQALRRFFKTSGTTTSNSSGDICHVDIHMNPETKDQFVLRDDIKLALNDALHVRHQTRVIACMKDEGLVTLMPHRIVAKLEVVLNVVVSEQLTHTDDTQPRAKPGLRPCGTRENYTHIHSPSAGPRLRDPQAPTDTNGLKRKADKSSEL
ncbi:hypothetical protein BGZ96_005940 [Linnemannia gamsii]|uniref:Uncharacterized protein n=1 Tax=Linnemannia gamsii TaxID=64522 RepID=A0ABQ7K4F7_9FUNG|nr:hypothetical protein BGZ96_005940 [Linnemannia gamsii]